MAVLDGVPSIRLEGNVARASALIPEAEVLLQQAQAITRRADVPTFSMSRRVSDDEYIYVLVAGGQNIIQISAGVVVPDEVIPEIYKYDPTLFPSFLSGLILDGGLYEERQVLTAAGPETVFVCKSFAPTRDCAKVQGIELGRQPARRLSVKPWAGFDELNNQVSASPLVFTQYTKLRASMYSGTMRKVAQITMGLGKIKPNMLVDPKLPTQPELAKKYIKDVEQNGVQIRYDYKFNRTHGIFRAEDKTLWLVEIGIGRGVVAMPLPIFPHSDTEGFYTRALARGDQSMSDMIEDLGCLPTGEAFPADTAVFAKKVADGDILILLNSNDLSDFYKMSGFSSSCGWAFNLKGSQAHNVGYWYPEESVFQKSAHYQISINIGPVNTNRKNGQPVATGTAKMTKQKEGWLWSPTARISYIPVKYYEPLLPGLLSHSAKPLGPGDAPLVDSPVFVAFIDDELKVAYHYRNNKSTLKNEVDTDKVNGECLLEGAWLTTTTTGYETLPTMPYTNDLDPRRPLQDTVSTTKLNSESLGFDPFQFTDLIESPETSYIWRNKVYRQTTVTEYKGHETLEACLMVPQYSREAYYYYEGNAFGLGHTGLTQVTYAYITDPNVAWGWRDFPRINPPPWPAGWGCAISNCGGKNKERRVSCLVFEGYDYFGDWKVGPFPADCRSYADSGPQLSQCQDVVSACGTPPVRNPYTTTWNKGNDFTGKITLYMSGLNGPQILPVTESQFNIAMVPSPDPDTEIVQFIAAESSAIGDDGAIFETGLTGYGTIKVVGFTPLPLVKEDGLPAFIGVNKP